jgi:hypothetical protein
MVGSNSKKGNSSSANVAAFSGYCEIMPSSTSKDCSLPKATSASMDNSKSVPAVCRDGNTREEYRFESVTKITTYYAIENLKSWPTGQATGNRTDSNNSTNGNTHSDAVRFNLVR